MSPIVRGSVAIDTVPLPEKELGMPTKFGKVLRRGTKYFVAVGRREVEIPVGFVVSKADIDKFIGKPVIVVFSKLKPSEIVAIGYYSLIKSTIVFKKWILCYIPVPDLIRRFNQEIRKTVLNKLVNEKIISRQLVKEINVRF
jgi:hypothetical protein